MSCIWGEQSPKNIFLKWFPLWKMWESLLICVVWFVISAAQLQGWMCGEWEILSHASFFSFSFPFHSLLHQRFMTGEKIKEKQMQTLSQESLLDYISALLTNCLIKFTWLSQQIRWEILTHCPPGYIEDRWYLLVKIRYELLYKMKIS